MIWAEARPAVKPSRPAPLPAGEGSRTGAGTVWDGIGSSMLPSIPPGSRLDLEPVGGRSESLAIGDVVVYLGSDSEFIAHRVVGIEDGPEGCVLVTRGDNQDRDDRVPASAAAFKVLRVSRGRITYSTDGPIGKTVARLAVRGGLSWRAFRRIATRALRLTSRCTTWRWA